MLDDLKKIHERDAQDALGVAEKQWQQLEYAFEITYGARYREERGEQPQDAPLYGASDQVTIKNIVFAGMGGSALAAEVAKSWPGFEWPFEICRDYVLPKYVTKDTLVIVSSYSGNTEETLAALADAEAKRACIAVITSGGTLADIANDKKYPLLLIPHGLQPRHAVLYSFKALMTLLSECWLYDGLIADAFAEKAQKLKAQIVQWVPTVATKNNLAKQIAQECMGTSVVIYAGPKLAPAAYKWKISFNENAKHIAWWNQYSELNHNEFEGWVKQPVHKPYTVVELRSNLEHPRIQKRFEVTERLLSGLRPAPIVVVPVGDTLLEQLLYAIALGDFVTIYLALLGNINPTPVELIEKFKRTLSE